MGNRFISTAIAYVNAEPHLGHALELVLTDALARFHRSEGDEVCFVTGTDENSLKSTSPALVERNAGLFRSLADRIGVSYGRFVRTSVDLDHRRTVERIWRAAEASGDLYRGRYSGRYCVGCEAFLGERDLVAGRCPEHLKEPELIEEENVFFRLSRHLDAIRERIQSGELEILPARARSDALAALDEGVPDLSVSRSAARTGGWGLPVPGDPSQVIYVWYDALATYLTGSGERWHDSHRTHVIGKGIARFHTIYWPAFLLSAGLPLPHRILVHGYLTVDGRKISKSLGNTVDPHALIDRYGVDALRWYLLRHVRSTEDGDFTAQRFDEIYRAELVHGLGNLVGRVIGLCAKLGVREEEAPIGERRAERAETGARAQPERVPSDGALSEAVRHAVDRFALDEATGAIWSAVEETNAFLQAEAPWKQGALQSDAVATVLRALASVRAIADALAPFLPGTARAIAARLDARVPAPPLFEDLRRRAIHS